MHIVIAGNMGSGKTTLTNMLAKHYGWKPQFEAVDYNPYLEDFYSDPIRWSFNIEVYFLKQRFKDMLKIAESNDTIVQDRSIYEGVYVFATNNYDMGNLEERDFITYMELFKQMTEVVKEPDLMIYLRASVPHLIEHIQKRGREYEQQLPIDYLKNLNEKYEDFIFNKYKGQLMVIETDNLDFEHNKHDFNGITDRIDALLYGLFSVTQKENITSTKP